MGNNNLYKVENTLRSIAKRYKSVKYSLGLAILFLMMGVGAFFRRGKSRSKWSTNKRRNSDIKRKLKKFSRKLAI